MLLLIFLACQLAYSQVAVNGLVTTEDDQPLAKASVYINGSSVGSLTDEKGGFSLLMEKPGFAEIVVSYVGYETLLYKHDFTKPISKIVFKLEPKVKTLRDVVILTTDLRKQWMKIFKENFLGITSAADNCTIQNEEAIQFEKGNGREIKAFSDEPLVIINKELGYKVQFDLVAFYYTNERTFFAGYSKFEELTANPAKKYLNRRKDYYKGSTTHFFKALVANKLKEEGFRIRLLKKSVLDSTPGVPLSKQQREVTLSLPIKVDSIIQPDTGNKKEMYRLQWDGRLQVTYNQSPDYTYALMKKTFVSGVMRHGFTAYIDLLETPLLMDAQAAFQNPVALQYSGFWRYEKVAAMLPLDYTP
jgi:hypothetical protein